MRDNSAHSAECILSKGGLKKENCRIKYGNVQWPWSQSIKGLVVLLVCNVCSPGLCDNFGCSVMCPHRYHARNASQLCYICNIEHYKFHFPLCIVK